MATGTSPDSDITPQSHVPPFSPVESKIRPRRAALIVNPHSSNGHTGQRLGILKESMRERAASREIELEFLESSRPSHPIELAREALINGFDRIIAAGGDGTVNEVINGFFHDGRLVRPGASLAIYPQGTASDFSRTLNLPRDDSALDLLLEPANTMIDIGWVILHDKEGQEITRYFANIGHFGLAGLISKRISRGRKFLGGFIPYLFGVLKTLWTFDKPLMEIRVDDRTITGRCLNVVVANGRYCGGGLEVSPQACLDSGHFEIGVVGDVTRGEVLRGMAELYLMHYAHEEKVWRGVGRELTASADHRVYVNLDGEAAGRLPARFRAIPRVLPVVSGPPPGPPNPALTVLNP